MQNSAADVNGMVTHFQQGYLLLLHKWHSRHIWRLRLFIGLVG